MVRDKIAAYIAENRERFIEELRRFLMQKSISTENIGMEECAALLRDELEKQGFETGIQELDGAMPSVWGISDGKEASTAKKAVLVYGHYDVQSPHPLELWESDPFGAETRDGHIFARGATDDKGNIWANLKAAETVKAVLGHIPVSLRFLFEGEEEIGSPNLDRMMQELSGRLSSDLALDCDRGVHETGRPQIYLGNKGIVSAELIAKRAWRDVHSGHAPLIPNAAYDLMRLITSMRDQDGTILIDDYLANVKGPSPEEAELLDTIPYDREEFLKSYGLRDTHGAKDPRGMLESLLYCPT
ncbi:MAG: M20/M25/M40 family metallo-hydrolase, partial [Firmicutes bacterium]|nr:M20/M25/M40 family metallo-hydrolase [Candidatus Fermentithermobacillaceae bacterium]